MNKQFFSFSRREQRPLLKLWSCILSLVKRANCLHRLHLLPSAINESLIAPPGALDKAQFDLRIIRLREAFVPPTLDILFENPYFVSRQRRWPFSSSRFLLFLLSVCFSASRYEHVVTVHYRRQYDTAWKGSFRCEELPLERKVERNAARVERRETQFLLNLLFLGKQKQTPGPFEQITTLPTPRFVAISKCRQF